MKFLLDSDYLFASIVPTDPNHKKAREIFSQLHPNSQLYISNLVIYETATVINYKAGFQASQTFQSILSHMTFEKIWFTEQDEINTFQLFNSQSQKGISFIDCSNIILLHKHNFNHILSFDQFYDKMIKFPRSVCLKSP